MRSELGGWGFTLGHNIHSTPAYGALSVNSALWDQTQQKQQPWSQPHSNMLCHTCLSSHHVFWFLRIVLMRSKSWKHYKLMQNIMAAEALLFISKQGPSLSIHISSSPLPQTLGARCLLHQLFILPRPANWLPGSLLCASPGISNCSRTFSHISEHFLQCLAHVWPYNWGLIIFVIWKLNLPFDT